MVEPSASALHEPSALPAPQQAASAERRPSLPTTRRLPPTSNGCSSAKRLEETSSELRGSVGWPGALLSDYSGENSYARATRMVEAEAARKARLRATRKESLLAGDTPQELQGERAGPGRITRTTTSLTTTPASTGGFGWWRASGRAASWRRRALRSPS